jgi:hypothetical protein
MSGNNGPVIASHPRGLAASASPLREPKISQIYVTDKFM